jgi:prepilin-type N-terminal cleavage/methylation domain-containing protein
MKKKGFTLVEIMVSLVILSLLASGMLSVFVSSRKLVSRSKRRLYATEIARREIDSRRDRIRADTWCLTGGANFLDPTATWSNCASAAYPGFTVECRVEGIPGRDYRKLSVRVRWNEPNV